MVLTGTRRVALCLLSAGLLAGAAPARAQSNTLLVAAYPAVDKIIESAQVAWKKQHPDIAIKVVSRAFDDHHTAMTTALATASNVPDVMAVEFTHLGRFAAGGALEDLVQPPYQARQQQARIVPFAWRQATTASGALVGMPTDIGPGTLLLRQDLLQKAGVDPVAMTRTWDSFVAAGERIKASTGAYLVAHARDLKDIMIRSNVRPGDGLYFDGAGKPLVDSPRFVRAFELARTVRRQKLDGKIAAWSNEWSQALRRGGIATQMSGAWLAGHLATWIAPDTKGQWRAAHLPEGAWAAWGGNFYAIPKASRNKALAWEFIQLMTLERSIQLGAFKAQDAFPALLDAHTDAFYDEGIAFLGGQKARTLWREAALKIQAVQVHKLDPIADEIINTELDKVLDQGKDIAQALADAKNLLERRARR